MPTTQQLRDQLSSGSLDARAFTSQCLDIIKAREPDIQAWEWLDEQVANQAAQEADDQRQSGSSCGALHGLPIGVKDIIDTAGIPTANGCALDAGRTPTEDAWVVERMKAEGAIMLGKTVTTELAYLSPSKTRNPHDLSRTPGGSSSGSAAAVAAGMVPLAIGTQTGGSVIRPASYCGVVGFKPSFGAIPRCGVLNQSPSLDTLGVFSRDVEGAALLAEALFGFDSRDPATTQRSFPDLLKTALSAPPHAPRLAVVMTPYISLAEKEVPEALRAFAKGLGEHCFDAELPAAFEHVPEIRARINLAEMARNFSHYEKTDRGKLSLEMQESLDAGHQILAPDYLEALDWPATLNTALEPLFERCDAILTPAATGPALAGLKSTGDSVFNGLWTLCGNPAITLPLLTSSIGLPMGVQLVGKRGDDAQLLRTARWLTEQLR